jgi:hypothetical protein
MTFGMRPWQRNQGQSASGKPGAVQFLFEKLALNSRIHLNTVVAEHRKELIDRNDWRVGHDREIADTYEIYERNNPDGEAEYFEWNEPERLANWIDERDAASRS